MCLQLYSAECIGCFMYAPDMCVCSFIHIHSLLIVPVMCMLFLFWNTRDCAFVHARAQLTFPDMHALVYSVTPDSVCVFVHAHGQL